MGCAGHAAINGAHPVRNDRGATSTGFRAPLLRQSIFTSTAVTFVNGLPVDTKTLPVASREARLLGGRDLKPENSVNLSAGVTMQPSKNLTVAAATSTSRASRRWS